MGAAKCGMEVIMIRHVVMWKFKEENKKANMEHAREILFALKPVIKELRRMEIGFDFSKTDMSYDMMLLTEFDSVEDMKTYAVHPVHLKVSGFIRSVIESRVVLDCDLDNA